jgi:murein DD-endopeptidase MepM/ murein hydrolase activator NlpD
MKWISVTRGQNVKAGDVIGYLPKVSQNLGETLIHLDWKIAVGSGEGTFVCPTPYFSSSWVSANEATLVSKLSACSALCSE